MQPLAFVVGGRVASMGAIHDIVVLVRAAFGRLGCVFGSHVRWSEVELHGNKVPIWHRCNIEKDDSAEVICEKFDDWKRVRCHRCNWTSPKEPERTPHGPRFCGSPGDEVR